MSKIMMTIAAFCCAMDWMVSMPLIELTDSSMGSIRDSSWLRTLLTARLTGWASSSPSKVRFSGAVDSYSLRFKDGLLVMTDRMGNDGIDTVAAVEVLRFAGGQSMADDAVLARLYEGVLGRQGSAAEIVTARRPAATRASSGGIG